MFILYNIQILGLFSKDKVVLIYILLAEYLNSQLDRFDKSKKRIIF